MHFGTIVHAATTAVGVALLVTACSSGGGATAKQGEPGISVRADPGSGATNHNTPDACALVTESDASALFGHPATNNATASLDDGVCAWTALGSLPSGAILRYSLVTHAYNGTSAYGEPKLPGGHEVAHVGQRAYAYKVGSNADTIETVNHNKTAVLIYSIHADEGARVPSMPDRAAKLTALARTAASRL